MQARLRALWALLLLLLPASAGAQNYQHEFPFVSLGSPCYRFEITRTAFNGATALWATPQCGYTEPEGEILSTVIQYSATTGYNSSWEIVTRVCPDAASAETGVGCTPPEMSQALEGNYLLRGNDPSVRTIGDVTNDGVVGITDQVIISADYGSVFRESNFDSRLLLCPAGVIVGPQGLVYDPSGSPIPPLQEN